MRLLACSVVLLSAACNGGDSRSDSISVHLSSTETTGRRAAANSQVRGLYMNDIQVVLLDHRPGESVQNEPTDQRPNWSVYPLVEGIEPHLLLQQNGNLDVGGTEGLDRGRWTDTFRDTVGFFDIDYVSVDIVRTGVLYDTVGGTHVSDYVYVGMNAQNNGFDGEQPIGGRYPQFASVPGRFVEPVFPTYEVIGMGDSRFQAIHVLFADASVFPEARVQLRTFDNAGGWELTFDSAGTPSAAQQEVMDSYVAELLNGGGAEHIVVVPMSETVRIELDSALAAGQPTVDTLLEEQGWATDIAFDLAAVLDEDLSTLEDVDSVGTMYELTIPEPVQTGTYSVTIDGEDLTCEVVDVSAGLSDVTGPCAAAFSENRARVIVASDLDDMRADGLFLFADRPFYAQTSDPKMSLSRVQDATPSVVFADTGSLVPFGLNIGFGENAGGTCTVGTAVPEADWCGSYTPTTRTATCCRCPNGTVGTAASGNVTCQ